MTRQAWIVVDLGFGDAGKGTVTDFLVRDRGAKTVVRYNGGPQAAHRVVTSDGRAHVFAQLGAGTFVPGVRTVLAATMAVEPWALLDENDYLRRQGVEDALERLTIHPDCVVVTPMHRNANRARELARGERRHGSCGVGVGEAVADARSGAPTIRVRDLFDAPRLLRSLQAIDDYKRSIDGYVPVADLDLWAEVPRRLLANRIRVADGIADALQGHVVFEGAHGVLLDEDHGLHPYTTWSSCTTRHADALLSDFDGAVQRLGVVRAYATRHGPGPFPTEVPGLLAGVEAANPDGPWQGPFRVGWFDAVLTRYAIRANGGVDGLAVTCLDHVVADWRMADAYDGQRDITLHGAPGDLIAQEQLTQRLFAAKPDYRGGDPLSCISELAPIRLTSRGPTAADKAWLTRP